MLKGYFYRRPSDGDITATDISIRFEINAKESILAKATNLNQEGMQFILPRGKVILVPEERILLVLSQPDNGEFKIQSEVYYFCNTVDTDGASVVCYGVKFIELSRATWEMVRDFCGAALPDLTFSPQIQPPVIKKPAVSGLEKTAATPYEFPERLVETPAVAAFNPVSPTLVPPFPGIFPEEKNPNPVFPAAAIHSPVIPPIVPVDIPAPPVIPPVQNNEFTGKNPVISNEFPAKQPFSSDILSPLNAVEPKTADPLQNSIQALAASLAAPPAPQTQPKAQSLSQEMIDRLIEKLQTDTHETPQNIAKSIPNPAQQYTNPSLNQLWVTESEITSAKANLFPDQPAHDPVAEFEKGVTIKNDPLEHTGKSLYSDFLIDQDPFAKPVNPDMSKPVNPYQSPAEPFSNPSVNSSLGLDNPFKSNFEPNPPVEKSVFPPTMTSGASLVDLIVDSNKPANPPQAVTPFEVPKKNPLESTVPAFETNAKPGISIEELRAVENQTAVKPEFSAAPPAVKEQPPIAKTAAESLAAIPTIKPGAAGSGASMDQKAIDKLVQSLLQEQNQTPPAVANSGVPLPVEPFAPINTPVHHDPRPVEPKSDPFLQGFTSPKPPVNPEPVNAPSYQTEPRNPVVSPPPVPKTPGFAATPQSSNPPGFGPMTPDPNKTRVMDQKSIDLIVQSLTQGGGQIPPATPMAPTPTPMPTPPSASSFSPIKPLNPGENKRTLDQKAIDQVVQALTQNSTPKSVPPVTPVTNIPTPLNRNFGTTQSSNFRPSEPFHSNEKKNSFGLASLTATLQLEKGEVLTCSVEQVYVGGIMVHVDKELPLNSALKINIMGDDTRILDIQGACTNCEPGRPEKPGFLAEIFFKNLTNAHMEQFRTLISKLDTK